MAQSGNLVVFGDAGEALGEACMKQIYTYGKIFGADCEEEKMNKQAKLKELLKKDQILFYSARKLYNFNIDNYLKNKTHPRQSWTFDIIFS